MRGGGWFFIFFFFFFLQLQLDPCRRRSQPASRQKKLLIGKQRHLVGDKDSASPQMFFPTDLIERKLNVRQKTFEIVSLCPKP